MPYPYAAENHQETNADIYVEPAPPKNFSNRADARGHGRRISDLLGDDTARAHISAASKAMAPDDAAQKVADVIEQTAKAGA